jgi:hypothetical protein
VCVVDVGAKRGIMRTKYSTCSVVWTDLIYSTDSTVCYVSVFAVAACVIDCMCRGMESRQEVYTLAGK